MKYTAVEAKLSSMCGVVGRSGLGTACIILIMSDRCFAFFLVALARRFIGMIALLVCLSFAYSRCFCAIDVPVFRMNAVNEFESIQLFSPLIDRYLIWVKK